MTSTSSKEEDFIVNLFWTLKRLGIYNGSASGIEAGGIRVPHSAVKRLTVMSMKV